MVLRLHSSSPPFKSYFWLGQGNHSGPSFTGTAPAEILQQPCVLGRTLPVPLQSIQNPRSLTSFPWVSSNLKKQKRAAESPPKPHVFFAEMFIV